jgi:hypothetical protein
MTEKSKKIVVIEERISRLTLYSILTDLHSNVAGPVVVNVGRRKKISCCLAAGIVFVIGGLVTALIRITNQSVAEAMVTVTGVPEPIATSTVLPMERSFLEDALRALENNS